MGNPPGLKGHEHHWYNGDSNSDTIWWYCGGCTSVMTTDPALTPERLREAAATMEAFWLSTGREYDPDVLRGEADQIESEPPFKAQG
jgi:hypothetical protein